MGKKRIVIGILYTPDPNWVAGEYYVQNVLSALRLCDDDQLPVIMVFCYEKTHYRHLQQITQYPYLRPRFIKREHSRLYYSLHYRIQKLFRFTLPDADAFGYPFEKCSFIYPIHYLTYIADKKKAVGWIPDFQERYLPELFSDKEIEERENRQRSYIRNHCPIVFSSHDCLSDWKRFYPEANENKTFVLHFAVTHPDFSHEDITQLKEKFHINGEYLFCANQFWKHKNHLFLFKAYLKAKKLGFKPKLVCSGKLTDYRDSDYTNRVRCFIQDNHLEDDIILLGFIKREEQLCLMNHSYAIVQPSLFEGWSTVVEDAKCLNKFIFLSNLNVHIEQAPKNVSYFDPHNEDNLAEQFIHVSPTNMPYDYSDSVRECGKSFLKLIHALSKR